LDSLARLTGHIVLHVTRPIHRIAPVADLFRTTTLELQVQRHVAPMREPI
jgi:hypothetical protein